MLLDMKPKIISFLKKNLKNYALVLFATKERQDIARKIDRITQESGMVMEKEEAFQVYLAVKNTRNVSGDIAEVGVFRGGSARLIAETKGDKALHLFDTFEGLPTVTDEDDRKDGKVHFYQGMYPASYEEVKAYLSLPNTIVYKGLFPQTGEPVKDKKFSFVHLDVDIYQSTKKSLEFFYPRMSRGGVILSHDYLQASGVRKAFDEFFSDKPETLLETIGSQVLVVKI